MMTVPAADLGEGTMPLTHVSGRLDSPPAFGHAHCDTS